jgi:heme oxygenase
LIFEAQTVAEKNISDARATAENLYKQKYEKLLNELELDYSEKIQKIIQNNKNSFNQYQQKIQDLPQDEKSFNELLDSLLFEGKK